MGSAFKGYGIGEVLWRKGGGSSIGNMVLDF